MCTAIGPGATIPASSALSLGEDAALSLGEGETPHELASGVPSLDVHRAPVITCMPNLWNSPTRRRRLGCVCSTGSPTTTHQSLAKSSSYIGRVRHLRRATPDLGRVGIRVRFLAQIFAGLLRSSGSGVGGLYLAT